MDKTKKRRIQILAASVFWLGVWQAAAVAIGQEVFLVSPVQAIGTLVELLPQAEFWQRIGFSAGRIEGGNDREVGRGEEISGGGGGVTGKKKKRLKWGSCMGGVRWYDYAT